MKKRKDSDLGERIRKYILNESDGPGSRIETEEQLARRFSVTRYQVRNVLNGLAHQGVISKSPRRGTFISEVNPKTISDYISLSYQVSNANLYEAIEARIVIELATIPLVVKRITPAQIAQMEDDVERMISNRLDPRVADAADMDFHATMLKSSGNQLLTSFNQVISRLFHQVEYRRKYWDPDTIERLALEHRGILEAIQDGDTELVIERLKKHLNYQRRIDQNEARNPTSEEPQ